MNKIEEIPELFIQSNNYADFFYDVISNKPLTKYQELESKRKILYELLSKFPVIYCSMNDECGCCSEYIDKCVYLVKHVDENKLLKFNFNRIRTNNYNPFEYIDSMISLFIPEYFINYDYQKYIKSFNEIFIFHNYYWLERTVSYHRILDGVFNTIYGMFQNKEVLSSDIVNIQNEYIFAIITAYLNLNNIHDYNLVKEYLNNIDYYQSKLKMNDCLLYNHGFYDYNKSKYVFNNFENIFRKNKTLIK